MGTESEPAVPPLEAGESVMSVEQLIDTIARVPSYIGIEPYLERVFGRNEYLVLARMFVVLSLALWAFVVVAAMNRCYSPML